MTEVVDIWNALCTRSGDTPRLAPWTRITSHHEQLINAQYLVLEAWGLFPFRPPADMNCILLFMHCRTTDAPANQRVPVPRVIHFASSPLLEHPCLVP